MAQIIACLSQKGGVGKSTLARLIARTYAEADWDVKIADFNTRQMTAVDWAAARMEANIKPDVPAQPFNSVKALSKERVDLIVADGKPDSDQTSLELARAADLVVIPTGTSLDDVKPQLLFAQELKAKGIPVAKMVFVINKTNDSVVATEETRASIESLGYRVIKTDLSAKAGYQNAQNAGRAISETTFVTLNDRAIQVVIEIIECMNVETGAAA